MAILIVGFLLLLGVILLYLGRGYWAWLAPGATQGQTGREVN